VPEPPPLKFQPPKGERHVLDNGIVIYLLEDHELPLIHGQALVRTGTIADPKGKGGLAALTGKVLRSGGSRKYDADQINETLEFLGASVETGMDLENGWASFTCLSRHLDTVLPIFADVLREPAFRQDKLEVDRQQMLEAIRRRNDDPREIARREARRLLFGPDHPYGRRYEAAEVESITREDLVEFHKTYFQPQALVLSIAGDFQAATLLAALQGLFGDWTAASPASIPQPAPAASRGRKVTLLSKDNVTQTSFRVVQTALKRHEADHFSFEVMNDILGGNSFVSRLFTDIRSRKGLAYGVGSLFAEWAQAGYFAAACGTRNENAPQALAEILRHIRAIRETPVSASELATAKNSIINSFIFNYQTPAQIINQRASLEYFGFPPDYLDTYVDKIRMVDEQAVLAAARKWLKPDDSLILVVGPSALKKELEAYGTVEVRPPD